MNLAQITDGEFPQQDESYPPGDDIPETLVPLLAAHLRGLGTGDRCVRSSTTTRWVQANPSFPAGHLLSQSQERRVHPSLGEVTFDLRGVPMRRQCAPQALWHFDKAASLARGLAGPSRDRWHA